MTIAAMIDSHPHASSVEHEALSQCIEACFSCSAACTSCADASLAEDMVQELVKCIRADLDCADVCEATGHVMARQTAFEPQLARYVLEACIQACRVCAEECDRHAEHHEHCRICAEACRRCEQACSDVLSTVG